MRFVICLTHRGFSHHWKNWNILRAKPISSTLTAMDKTRLLKRIVAELTDSLQILDKAARASHAEATHESSKAENKYDTRGLEAAYLARGQARQAREILEAIKDYENLSLKNFAPGEPIDMTALVELETDGAPAMFFIGPKCGGLEIKLQRREVTVITPQSPLGQNLLERKAGDKWAAKIGGSQVKYRIVSVA
jgi:hypothetical protein